MALQIVRQQSGKRMLKVGEPPDKQSAGGSPDNRSLRERVNEVQKTANIVQEQVTLLQDQLLDLLNTTATEAEDEPDDA
jgi:hypothetical protein